MSEVKVKFGADTTGFMAGLEALKAQSRHFAKEMGSMFLEMAGFVGVTTMLSEVVEKFDRIAKLSVQTGISTDSLQVLSHNAELSGTSIEMVANAVSRLNRQLAFPEVNDKTADAIHHLGLSVRELQGMSAEQQLEAIAKKMAGMEDASKRTAVAVALFGRSGREMIPFLESVANGMKKTTIASEETVKQIEEFDDALKSIKDSTMAALAPVVAIIYQIGRLWASIFGMLAKQLANAAEDIKMTFVALGEASKALIGRGSFKTAADILAQAHQDFKNKRSEILDEMFNTWADIGKQSRLALGIDTSEAHEKIKQISQEVVDLSGLQQRLSELEADHARRRLDLEKQITTLKAEQVNLQKQLLTAEPDERKGIEDKIVDAQKEIYRLQDQIEKDNEQKNEEIKKEVQDRQDRIERLQEQIKQKQFDELSNDAKRISLEKELTELKAQKESPDLEEELQKQLRVEEIQLLLKNLSRNQPILGGVSSLARIGGGGGVGGLENIAQEQLKVQKKIADGIDKLNTKGALKFQ